MPVGQGSGLNPVCVLEAGCPGNTMRSGSLWERVKVD